MVKNINGGSGHKGKARKHTTNNSNSNMINTRLALIDGELYAQVTKNMGNGMCHVICQDGKTRLCIIRGKFRGRGKRDNTITNGKWILIGLREYESEKKDKLENCDLLEVYQDTDKARLISRVPTMNWSIFVTNDNANSSNNNNSNVEFIDERQEDYLKLMKSIEDTPNNVILGVTGSATSNSVVEEEVDFNDI